MRAAIQIAGYHLLVLGGLLVIPAGFDFASGQIECVMVRALSGGIVSGLAVICVTAVRRDIDVCASTP